MVGGLALGAKAAARSCERAGARAPMHVTTHAWRKPLEPHDAPASSSAACRNLSLDRARAPDMARWDRIDPSTPNDTDGQGQANM